MWRFILCICIFAAAQKAHAQFDSRTLFRLKDWQVELTHDTSDGSLWCSAETTNRFGQLFSISAFDNNNMALFVMDHNWALAKRPVRFLIDIDYSRWVIDGTANEISVSLNFSDASKTISFLEQLQASSAVAVYNQTEDRLATFSLAGSRRALEELMACWDRIQKRDPFRTSKDPF